MEGKATAQRSLKDRTGYKREKLCCAGKTNNSQRVPRSKSLFSGDNMRKGAW